MLSSSAALIQFWENILFPNKRRFSSDVPESTLSAPIVMLLLAIAFGVAISACSKEFTQYAGFGPEWATRPWAYGFWAAVGSFDVQDMYKHYSAHENSTNWLPLLLFIYVFITSNFLVNVTTPPPTPRSLQPFRTFLLDVSPSIPH